MCHNDKMASGNLNIAGFLNPASLKDSRDGWEKIVALVVCKAGTSKDPAALRRVLAAWPTAVVLCGRTVGEGLAYPAASIEKDFAWATPHPAVDACKAFQKMPYDATTLDLAAVVFAVHPELGFFDLSEPGTIQMADDGKLEVKPAAGGKHRALSVAAAKSADLLKTYIDIASLKPERRPFNFRPPAPLSQPHLRFRRQRRNRVATRSSCDFHRKVVYSALW